MYILIAYPLYELVSEENTSKKNKPVKWADRCLAAFDKIDNLCCTTPDLAFMDFKQPFILHTDASEISLGQSYTKSFRVKNVCLGMEANPWKERATTWLTNWNFWLWSGP